MKCQVLFSLKIKTYFIVSFAKENDWCFKGQLKFHFNPFILTKELPTY